ncbi:hypothetical protein TNIN_405551 [Trichonephila inaurata madagascariensis]|uniref:Methyltransferase domain-containing protein n=1 Tax=Trichonephila inaurata madagascariensis TaxID=2747483 RepID=A0A8X6XFV3_9ARAC|nr:hypothetical protein TNIN_405551 [Trichonephila inaurata madagascariensis]
MNLEPNLYSNERIPLESVKSFLSRTLPQLEWNQSSNRYDVVLDAGCGPGGTTYQLILPLFSNVKKIFAVDLLPAAIDFAKNHNSHPLIEYSVANLEDCFILFQVDSQALGRSNNKTNLRLLYQLAERSTKCVSKCIQTLEKGAEAAVCFPLQTSYYDALLEVQNDPKWSNFLKNIETLIPESHHKKWNCTPYKEMLQDIGFEILYCREKVTTDDLDHETPSLRAQRSPPLDFHLLKGQRSFRVVVFVQNRRSGWG